MKKFKLLVLFLLFSISTMAQNILSYINTASDFFNKLDEGKYSEVQGFFDDSVKEKLPPENLEKMWTQVKSNLGNFESVEGAQNKTNGDYQVVILNCKFTNDNQPFQFVFNKSQKLVGFFILPKKQELSYKLPIYADTARYVEKLINIKSGEFELPAMLTLPKDSMNVPIVVFVHGSGPNDMDETIGAQKPFKDLAVGLASKGIGSIRYVKRTTIYPGKLSEVKTTKEEVIDDALAVINYSKTVPQANPAKVYIFGHSLGGMLAPKIASLNSDIKGIVIAAAPAKKLQDILIEQNNNIFSAAKDTSKAGKDALVRIIKEINLTKAFNSKTLNQDSVILGLPISYWADLNDYDQISTAKKLNQRVFLIQGGNDFQVTIKDYNLWIAALKGKKNVDYKLYPMLSHLFAFVSEKGIGAEYQERGNVDQTLIDDLASWLIEK